MSTPSDFYTGLIAELYEPLAVGISDSGRFIQFVQDQGEPALEVCCGTGLPLLDLLEAGLDVEGLDSSQDMLDLCAAAASNRGVTVELHQSMMQTFRLERKFRSVYVANGSITLLTSDNDLRLTLNSIVGCLTPDGSVLIDFETPDADILHKYVGHFKEKQHNGYTLRVGMTSLETSEDGSNVITNLRYEKIDSEGELEAVDKLWSRRIWSLERFSKILQESGLVVRNVVPLKNGVSQIFANLKG